MNTLDALLTLENSSSQLKTIEEFQSHTASLLKFVREQYFHTEQLRKELTNKTDELNVVLKRYVARKRPAPKIPYVYKIDTTDYLALEFDDLLERDAQRKLESYIPPPVAMDVVAEQIESPSETAVVVHVEPPTSVSIIERVRRRPEADIPQLVESLGVCSTLVEKRTILERQSNATLRKICKHVGCKGYSKSSTKDTLLIYMLDDPLI